MEENEVSGGRGGTTVPYINCEIIFLDHLRVILKTISCIKAKRKSVS